MSASPPPADPDNNERQLDALLQRLTRYYPRAIDPNLERCFRLLRDLGDPQTRLPPVIHIAGTNGKGSTLATIRAIAEAAGMVCHVMISPHLVRFNERLVIRGEEISTPSLLSLLEEVENKNAGQPTTSFELVTAAGFLQFSRHPADLCLLETGMGGRLDATNVVSRPLATVITVISFDHTQYLGTRLDQIAGEKAAIMKPGVPCVIGPQTREGIDAGVMEVFGENAARTGSPLYRHGIDWSFSPAKTGFILHAPGQDLELPRPNLLGAHQIGNAATAVMTLLACRDNLPHPVNPDALKMGIGQVHWPGRLQQLRAGPLARLLPKGWQLWLDGGHNDTGGQALAAQAAAWHEEDGLDLHLICGMLNTKDPCAFLSPLGEYLVSARSVTIPDQPLSLSAEELATLSTQIGAALLPEKDVKSAIQAILKESARPGRILIAGSLYLAGNILAENG